MDLTANQVMRRSITAPRCINRQGREVQAKQPLTHSSRKVRALGTVFAHLGSGLANLRGRGRRYAMTTTRQWTGQHELLHWLLVIATAIALTLLLARLLGGAG
jgi:hypothetical protein